MVYTEAIRPWRVLPMPARQSGKIIQSGLPNQKDENQKQYSFQLGQILQTTLDVYDLVKRFHQELQQVVPYHSFHYHNLQTQHGLDIGSSKSHQASYQLMLEGLALGDIYVTRTYEFSTEELHTIENALEHLIYPLRNALSYHAAVKNSFTDPLTQVGNRGAFDKALAREIDFAKRHHAPFSLLVIDLDKFKAVNDKHGHQAGDAVLCMIAKLMTQLNRNTDPLFRYGGEEFVMILSHTNLAGAKFVGERMRQQVEHHEFMVQGVKIPVTISIGITEFQEKDNAQLLFKRADSALYEAKKLGRNRVTYQ